MGEAFDRTGHFLGSVEAETKREVLEQLEKKFGEQAAEIRIRTLQGGDSDPAMKSDVPMEPMEKFFAFEHLPAHLRAVSQPFGELAAHVIKTLPRNPERTVALRKLLEAKDCAVRSLL